MRRIAAFLRRSPDTATAEELRPFLLHMVDTGTAPPTINSTLSGQKFSFDVALGHGELMVKMQPVHHRRPLPVVLSGEEVARLITAAGTRQPQPAARREDLARFGRLGSSRLTHRLAALRRDGPLCQAGRFRGLPRSSTSQNRRRELPRPHPERQPRERFIPPGLIHPATCSRPGAIALGCFPKLL